MGFHFIGIFPPSRSTRKCTSSHLYLLRNMDCIRRWPIHPFAISLFSAQNFLIAVILLMSGAHGYSVCRGTAHLQVPEARLLAILSLAPRIPPLPRDLPLLPTPGQQGAPAKSVKCEPGALAGSVLPLVAARASGCELVEESVIQRSADGHGYADHRDGDLGG